MIAITRVENEYSIGDTVTRQSGWYTEDGTFLRGEKILPEDEAGFRIWKQQQPPMPESKARRLYEARRKDV
jgi:hypothetical protein